MALARGSTLLMRFLGADMVAALAGYCHALTRPLWSFWQINVFFVDHAKFQIKHALFLVLSGVAWSDLPALGIPPPDYHIPAHSVVRSPR